MTSSLAGTPDPTPTEATVASILGVRDPLLFRRHHSSQKAHCILKRVRFTTTPTEDETKHGIVYFSLFAQKRIDVRPGKEILVCVDSSEDGFFSDQAILLAGIINDPAFHDDESDAEKGMQSAPSVEVIATNLVPPHLRRRGTLKLNEAKPDPEKVTPHPDYASMGVQVEPERIAASVQADPGFSSKGTQMERITSRDVPIQASIPTSNQETQAVPSTGSRCVQAQPSLKSSAVQAKPLYVSCVTQAEPNYRSRPIQAQAPYRSSSVQAGPNYSSSSAQVKPETLTQTVQVQPNTRSSGIQAIPDYRSESTQAQANIETTSKMIQAAGSASSKSIQAVTSTASQHTQAEVSRVSRPVQAQSSTESKRVQASTATVSKTVQASTETTSKTSQASTSTTSKGSQADVSRETKFVQSSVQDYRAPGIQQLALPMSVATSQTDTNSVAMGVQAETSSATQGVQTATGLTVSGQGVQTISTLTSHSTQVDEDDGILSSMDESPAPSRSASPKITGVQETPLNSSVKSTSTRSLVAKEAAAKNPFVFGGFVEKFDEPASSLPGRSHPPAHNSSTRSTSSDVSRGVTNPVSNEENPPDPKSLVQIKPGLFSNPLGIRTPSASLLRSLPTSSRPVGQIRPLTIGPSWGSAKVQPSFARSQSTSSSSSSKSPVTPGAKASTTTKSVSPTTKQGFPPSVPSSTSPPHSSSPPPSERSKWRKVNGTSEPSISPTRSPTALSVILPSVSRHSTSSPLSAVSPSRLSASSSNDSIPGLSLERKAPHPPTTPPQSLPSDDLKVGTSIANNPVAATEPKAVSTLLGLLVSTPPAALEENLCRTLPPSQSAIPIPSGTSVKGSTTPTSQQDGPHETVALTGKRKRGTSVDITPPISSSPPKFAPVDPPAVVHPNDFSHQIPIPLFADPKPSSLAQASRERRRPPSPERKTSYIPPGGFIGSVPKPLHHPLPPKPSTSSGPARTAQRPVQGNTQTPQRDSWPNRSSSGERRRPSASDGLSWTARNDRDPWDTEDYNFGRRRSPGSLRPSQAPTDHKTTSGHSDVLSKDPVAVSGIRPTKSITATPTSGKVPLPSEVRKDVPEPSISFASALWSQPEPSPVKVPTRPAANTDPPQTRAALSKAASASTLAVSPQKSLDPGKRSVPLSAVGVSQIHTEPPKQGDRVDPSPPSTTTSSDPSTNTGPKPSDLPKFLPGDSNATGPLLTNAQQSTSTLQSLGVVIRKSNSSSKGANVASGTGLQVDKTLTSQKAVASTDLTHVPDSTSTGGSMSTQPPPVPPRKVTAPSKRKLSPQAPGAGKPQQGEPAAKRRKSQDASTALNQMAPMSTPSASSSNGLHPTPSSTDSQSTPTTSHPTRHRPSSSTTIPPSNSTPNKPPVALPILKPTKPLPVRGKPGAANSSTSASTPRINTATPATPGAPSSVASTPTTSRPAIRPPQRKKRKVPAKWPTNNGLYSTKLEPLEAVGKKKTATAGNDQPGTVKIKRVSFSPDGSHIAVCCSDKSIRIWHNRTKMESARLTHNDEVVDVVWQEGGAGLILLSEGDNVVSKWTRGAGGKWKWDKLLDLGRDIAPWEPGDHSCLAYHRDRIAVSLPFAGLKVFIFQNGSWVRQQAHSKRNITAMKFIDDGKALIGGLKQGLVWHISVPVGHFRSVALMPIPIQSLDIHPNGSQALIGLSTGEAQIVSIAQLDGGGAAVTEKTYSNTSTTSLPPGAGYGAAFAANGQAVIFGSVDGCALVWDTKKSAVVYALEHEEDDEVKTLAVFNGANKTRGGNMVTGTKNGELVWWLQPVGSTQTEPAPKRSKNG